MGGLVGVIDNAGSTVSNSFAMGDVTATGDQVGGLAGSLLNASTVDNSFASGNVMGSNLVGGFIGVAFPNITITDAYASGLRFLCDIQVEMYRSV